MSFIAEPKPRHMPTEGDAFDQFVAVLWIVSEIAFDVFGMFFWAALALFFLKAISYPA
jgi:hypothetical protein